jgi:hypothetical protein
MSERNQTNRDNRASVRPRFTWGGTAVALLGMLGIALAMTNHATVWTWVAVAVTVLGLLLAWRGGAMYDVHGAKPPEEELGEALHGESHTGISPQDRVTGPGARAGAAVATREAQALVRSRIEYRPPLAPLGAIGLLLVGAWLLISRGALHYPYNAIGQASSLRDLGFGLVFFLGGLWLRQVGPSRIATGLSLLCGVLLVLSGVFLAHSSGVVRVNEIAMGAVALLAAAVTLESRRSHTTS